MPRGPIFITIQYFYDAANNRYKFDFSSPYGGIELTQIALFRHCALGFAVVFTGDQRIAAIDEFDWDMFRTVLEAHNIVLEYKES